MISEETTELSVTAEEKANICQQNIKQYETEALQQRILISAMESLEDDPVAAHEAEQRRAELRRVEARIAAFREALSE